MTDSTAIMPTNGSALIASPALVKKIEAIEAFVSNNAIVGSDVEQVGSIMAAARAASFITQMQAMVDDEVVGQFLTLQGSPLGFRTDKDKEGGYKAAVVRDALIEASAKGFDMVMNRSNIIGCRWYPTGPGFEQFFKRRFVGNDGTPRVTDIRVSLQVPKLITDNRAVVSGKIEYRLDGKADAITREIPIRINAGQGDDAILGKAKRKLLAEIYSRVTGSEITDGDVEDSDGAIPVVSTPVSSGVKPETLAKLDASFKADEAAFNAYLVTAKKITEGQTYRDMSEVDALQCVEYANGILKKIRK